MGLLNDFDKRGELFPNFHWTEVRVIAHSEEFEVKDFGLAIEVTDLLFVLWYACLLWKLQIQLTLQKFDASAFFYSVFRSIRTKELNSKLDDVLS